ncbi:MAG TPA: dicarboxylate/amino acid:cation symporter [Burkholderiaceae bacterium]
MKKPLYKTLYVWVLIAIVLGVAFGALYPGNAIDMKPLSDGFIKLIKMIVAPVIFCTVASGIASMESLKKMGRVGGKALLYFEVVSTVALGLGLLVANVLRPGDGVDTSGLDPSAVAEYAKKQMTFVEFVLNIIPTTMVDAFAKGEILQVLLVAILFGIALAQLGEKGKPILTFIDDISKVIFRVFSLVVLVAPIGAFGAMAFVVGKYGLHTLLPLVKLVGTFYLTSLIFVFVVLGAIAKVTGFSILRFVIYIKEELFIVLGSSSSESGLARLMLKLEKLGCSKRVVNLVVPTGYSFNLDGTNIYMTLAALFIAQATNTDLTFAQQFTIFSVAMVTSKGASGVTGAGFITLAATLAVVPSIPIGALSLIVGVDRFMSECRALTNFVGNGVAAIVMSAWERELDRDVLHAELHSKSAANIDAAI